MLRGDVSEPVTVAVDGLHVSQLEFDPDGFPIFNLNFTEDSAVVPGVQLFVGTQDSEYLPTISGTPLLNPSPTNPNGLAVVMQPEGYLLDFSDLAPGLILPVPDVRFQQPGLPLQKSESISATSTVDDPAPTATQFNGNAELFDLDDFYVGFFLRFTSGPLAGQTEQIVDYVGATRTFVFNAGAFSGPPNDGDAFDLVRFSTDPFTVPFDFVGFDNHLDPGDMITVSRNPVQNHVALTHGGVTLTDQTFLFDTGAMMSTITVEEALALGLDLSAPESTIAIGGAGGVVEDIPGYTIDALAVPTADGGTITFHNVPVFVIDVADEIQGILGMNLFNSTSTFVYDPFDPQGCLLKVTFFSNEIGGSSPAIDPQMQAVLQALSPVFAGAVGINGLQLPGFDLPATNASHRYDLVGRVQETGDWWVGQSDGVSFNNGRWAKWSSNATWADGQVLVGDLNGDKLDDIVGRAAESGDWWVARSTGNGFVNERWGRWSPAVTWVDVHVADVNGDGLDDLVGRVQATGAWWVAASTGSSFVNQWWGNWSPAVTWVDVHVADVTGDGKDDLVGRVQASGDWWVARSTGIGFISEWWGRWSPAVTWVDVRVGHFNNDGYDDIVGRVQASGDWWVGRSTGTGFVNERWGRWSPAVNWVDVQTGKFNSDDVYDLVGRVRQSGDWWVAKSNGTNGFTSERWGHWYPGVTWTDVNVTDVNGDFRDDVIGRVGATGAWWVARSNGTSFNNEHWTNWSSTVGWDDVLVGNFTNGAALLAAGSGAGEPASQPPLTPEELAPIMTTAIDLWADTGLSRFQLDRLRQADVRIAELPGARLGELLGTTITLDVTAAGHGWFIDPTPYDNEEFGSITDQGLQAVSDSPAFGQMDLLTVVLHEFGHVLGLPDDPAGAHPDSPMNGWLADGVRRLPTEAELALLLANL